MNYINVGKITNTHGIKGEVKVLSSFSKKEAIFKENFPIYIGDNKILETILQHRIHQKYDLITFKNINDINQVLKYKGLNIYINKDDLNLKEEYLIEDLIAFQIMTNNQNYGQVQDIVQNKAGNILLYIKYSKNYYLPYTKEFITNVDLKNKIIIAKRVEELL